VRGVDHVSIEQIDDAFDLIKISLPWSFDELRIDDPEFDRSERKRRRRKLKRWYSDVAVHQIASVIDTPGRNSWITGRGHTHDTNMRPGAWSCLGYRMWDTCYVVDFTLLGRGAMFWLRLPLNQHISAWPAVGFALRDANEWTPGYLVEINEWAKRAIMETYQYDT